MMFNPHKLGNPQDSQAHSPLNAIFDAYPGNAFSRAVNIADLRYNCQGPGP
jgi:hypothetical protein